MEQMMALVVLLAGATVGGLIVSRARIPGVLGVMTVGVLLGVGLDAYADVVPAFALLTAKDSVLKGREERTGDRFGLGRECERLGRPVAGAGAFEVGEHVSGSLLQGPAQGGELGEHLGDAGACRGRHRPDARRGRDASP